jgi:hypothetical protein
MAVPDPARYRFYLQDDPPSMLGIIILGALALASIVGVPVMLIGAMDVLIRDHNLRLALILLVATAGYLAVFLLIAWPAFQGLVHRRRNVANIYVAITDGNLVYQDYDDFNHLQKHVIPLHSIHEIGFETIHSGPDVPDTHLIRIRYLGEQGKQEYLDINYFFGSSQWPKDSSLLEILQREWRRHVF